MVEVILALAADTGSTNVACIDMPMNNSDNTIIMFLAFIFSPPSPFKKDS
jgi:hypothetical protein